MRIEREKAKIVKSLRNQSNIAKQHLDRETDSENSVADADDAQADSLVADLDVQTNELQTTEVAPIPEAERSPEMPRLSYEQLLKMHHETGAEQIAAKFKSVVIEDIAHDEQSASSIDSEQENSDVATVPKMNNIVGHDLEQIVEDENRQADEEETNDNISPQIHGLGGPPLTIS